ncbi:MAG TPA: hypothetical protein VG164_01420 [Trebonia sp.]|nr:hypothetical protein [Trebonia sp.]
MFVAVSNWQDMEAGTVPDKVTISHRGARYEIGRGKRYYGIWVADAPQSDPIDRWPETREGWAQAWTRFVSIETPQTIAAVEPSSSGVKFPGIRRWRAGRADGATAEDATAKNRRLSGPVIAAALLGFGVLIGIVGLFPDYFTGQSLASQTAELVPHLFYLAGWAVSAFLILRGARAGGPHGAEPSGLLRVGALLAAGLSAVTLGLFVSDLGEVVAGQSGTETGLILTLIGWLFCAAGSVVALVTRHARRDAEAETAGATDAGLAAARRGGPVRPRAEHVGPIALLVLGALGTVAAFAPSWDSYTLASSSGTQTITAGNAFSSPGVVITGNVLVMVAVVAVAVVAALWRPMRHGSALLAGAIVPMAAQAISALIQAGEPTSPTQFGISPSEAAAAGLTISSGVTPIFWVYCVFVIAMLISCAWMITEPVHPAAPPSAQPSWPGPIPPVTDTSDEIADSDDNHDQKNESDGIAADGAGDDDAAGDEESTYA